jgi:magnesium chelatase family protein
MSLAELYSRALSGMDAPEDVVDLHLANGLPSFTIIYTIVLIIMYIYQ